MRHPAMRHLAPLVCALCALPAPSAVAQGPGWPFHGVFSTDAHPVDGCRIVRAGAMVSHVQMGHGRFGLDFGMGALGDGASASVNADATLRDLATEGGSDAVVGARVQISHAGDAVFETGQNWRAGDDAFDGAGSYVAIAYGTPVEVACS